MKSKSLNANYHVGKIEDDTHLEDVYLLWRSVFGENFKAEAKYDWFYRSNVTSSGRIYLLFNGAQSSLVGVQGIAPRSWRIASQGTTVKQSQVGLLLDIAVDAQHRTLGPALKMIKNALGSEEQNFVIYYAFPNEKSETIFKRIGFKELGQFKRFVKVLRFNKYLQKHVSQPIANIIAAILNAGAYLKDWFMLFIVRRTFRGELVTRFDKRFDDLWDDSNRTSDIIANRDAKSLQWYFGANPIYDTKTFVAINNADDSYIGYVVFRRTQKNDVIIYDFFSRDSGKMLGVTLLLFVECIRKFDAGSITVGCHVSKQIEQQLKKVGFSCRDSRPIIYKVNNPALAIDLNAIYLTSYDKDQ